MKLFKCFGILFLGLVLAPNFAFAQSPSCQPADCAKMCPAKSSANAGAATSVDFVNLSSDMQAKVASCHARAAAAETATAKAVNQSAATQPAARMSCDPCPINWCKPTGAAAQSQPVQKAETGQLAKNK